MMEVVDDREHAQIVFVKKLEHIFFAGVGGNADEWFGLHFRHPLLGGSKEHARHRNGAAVAGIFVEDNDGVELLQVQLLVAQPLQDICTSQLLANIDKLPVNHAAGS